MKKCVRLSILCLLLLVSLAAVPVLAAAVSCPSSCSCLLPAEAKKLGSFSYCAGKQAVCDYDLLKNEKYCYEKPGTLAAPQLIITAYQVKTPTPTTLPVQKCPAGCTCMSSADGKGAGLSYCGSKQSACGSASGTHQYCFARPVTIPTTIQIVVPGLRVITPSGTAANRTTEPCSPGCTCLDPERADADGFRRCTGTSVPCDYDPTGRAMYCYTLERVARTNPVSAIPAALPSAEGSPAPVNVPVIAVEKSPESSSGPIAALFSFFASLFGASPAGSTPPQSSSLAPVPCNGVMTDIMTDPENCGGCGVVCESGSCVAGQCPDESGRLMACGPLQVRCNGSCTIVMSDDENCGSCGNRCPDESQCCSGRCIPRCLPQETCIDGSCRDTSSDPQYCGGTWERCEGRWPACCNGVCADFMEDERSCGECGYACRSGETCCSGSCTGIMTDSESCGACGHLCGWDLNAHSRTTCCGGACCPSGSDMCCHNTCCNLTAPEMACCSSGCANLDDDEQNCGRCGDRCPSGEECFYGTCYDPAVYQARVDCWTDHNTAPMRYERGEITYAEYDLMINTDCDAIGA